MLSPTPPSICDVLYLLHGGPPRDSRPRVSDQRIDGQVRSDVQNTESDKNTAVRSVHRVNAPGSEPRNHCIAFSPCQRSSRSRPAGIVFLVFYPGTRCMGPFEKLSRSLDVVPARILLSFKSSSSFRALVDRGRFLNYPIERLRSLWELRSAKPSLIISEALNCSRLYLRCYKSSE